MWVRVKRIQVTFGLLIQNFRAVLTCYNSYLLTLATLHNGHALAPIVIQKDHGQLLIKSAPHSLDHLRTPLIANMHHWAEYQGNLFFQVVAFFGSYLK